MISFEDKTDNHELDQHPALLEFFQSAMKWKPHGVNNSKRYFGFCAEQIPYAQNGAKVPQIRELPAWLDSEFCFPLNLQDSFFCNDNLRILIIFVRY